MPMEKTFRELMLNLRGLGERVQELGITVNQDRPKSNDAALVDDFEYAVFDVTGWLNEALGAAVEAHRAVEEQVDLSSGPPCAGGMSREVPPRRGHVFDQPLRLRASERPDPFWAGAARRMARLGGDGKGRHRALPETGGPGARFDY